MKCKILLFLSFLLAMQHLQAQNISGSTSIDYDPDSGMVRIVCETDLDDDAASFYLADVTCTVTADGAFMQTKNGTSTHGDQSTAVALIQFAGVP